MKRYSITHEKIFAEHISDKEVMYRIYEELLQVNN